MTDVRARTRQEGASEKLDTKTTQSNQIGSPAVDFPLNFPLLPLSARHGELRGPGPAGHAAAHARLRRLPAGVSLGGDVPLGAAARHLRLLPLALRALPLHAGRLEARTELLGEGIARGHRHGGAQVRYLGVGDSFDCSF